MVSVCRRASRDQLLTQGQATGKEEERKFGPQTYKETLWEGREPQALTCE